MTEFTRTRFGGKDYEKYTSEPVPVSDVAILDGIQEHLPNGFVSVSPSDAAGNIQPIASVTDGTVLVEGSPATHNGFEELADATIDLTDPTQASFQANMETIRVTPSAITGITHYIVTLTLNA